MKTFSYISVTSNSRSLTLLTLALMAIFMSGCGEKGKTPQATQIAAKINSEEITVSQVNNALASVPVIPGKTVEEARQEVLSNLIVQNLANQQAIKMKLDRNPPVMQAVENAKNTIIARAYMDPIVSGISKPTSDDVHKFYTEHPELFSDRHIYTIKELEVENKPDLAASIRGMADKGDSLDAIAAWLKAKNIASSIQTGIKPAEQLPLEMVSRFRKLPAGKLMVVELTKTISVLQVVNAKAEPVSKKLAAATIEEYLTNSRKKEALEREIKSLKAAAKIEYFGEFKEDTKATADVKPATVEASAKKPEVSSAPDLAKGVAGLK